MNAAKARITAAFVHFAVINTIPHKGQCLDAGLLIEAQDLGPMARFLRICGMDLNRLVLIVEIFAKAVRPLRVNLKPRLLAVASDSFT